MIVSVVDVAYVAATHDYRAHGNQNEETEDGEGDAAKRTAKKTA